MKASLNKKIHEVYVDPLPYELKSLPPLVPHNPVSVLWFLYAVFFQPNPVQKRIAGVLNLTDPDKATIVSDPEQMNRLWTMGFFGKGSLSRSEPSWFGRTARRLGLDGGELTFEELTEQRRRQRRKFKKERDAQEKLDLARRQQAEKGNDVVAPIESRSASPESDDEMVTPRPEDEALIRGNTILRLEHMQLMPCEAVFLSFGLDVLDLSVSGHLHNSPGPRADLLPYLCGGKLLLEYVAYHYFRSLGWCVRSGVKFGTDFILYARGPPFQHAEFAVMVLPATDDAAHEWYWAQSIARVVGGVKKTLMFAYVEGPDPRTVNWTHINSAQRFTALLAQYKVQTVLHARWAPNRTRD